MANASRGVPITNPSESDAAEHFRRAAAALHAGRQQEAAAEYELGLREAPNASDAHNNLGAIYLELGDYARAVRELQTAVNQRPENLDYQFNLGFGLFHLDRCTEALPHLRVAANSLAHQSDAGYIAGLCSYHLNRWADAVDEIEKTIAPGAATPEKLYILIRAARKAQKPNVAMKAFGELASHYPDSLFVHELLAEAYDLTSDSAAAEKEFARAVQVAPTEPGLNFDLGYVLWKEGRFADAAARFRRELVIDPHSNSSWYYLGAISLKLGQPTEALSCFQRALGSGNEYREAWIGLGEASEALHDFTAAESNFRKAISYFPDRVEPHYRLAQLLKRQNRLVEADQEFALVKQLEAQDRAREAAIITPSIPNQPPR